MHVSSLLSTAVLATSMLAGDASAGRLSDIARDPRRLRERTAAHSQTLEHGKSHHQFRFLSNQTKEYRVERLPDVHFDIGEMYSGLVPIDETDPSRALFFVFQPTIGPPVDEITIWLNGGPGCSSLEGFFQENGRFLWLPGTFAPVENIYSWVNLTNMLWVEQPVGTGFSIGTPTATTEEEIAVDFLGFFKNFEKLFGIKRFKVYVTGESYAGRYVPYISAAMLDEKDKENFDLGGALVYDPCIGQYDYFSEVPAVPFVRNNLNLFNFNSTFMTELEDLHQKCGYQDFLDKYYTFPASGVQPPKFFNYTSEGACDVFSTIYTAATTQNPCFNPYEVTQMCPLLWDVLDLRTAAIASSSSTATTGTEEADLAKANNKHRVYFDRPDVKHAMHAPPNITWRECSTTAVFVGGASAGPEQEGDLSRNPIEHVLPQVIEATNRVLIANGDYDYIILTNGTLLSIQNMTWNGRLGFEKEPHTPIVIGLEEERKNKDAGRGHGVGGITMGVQHFERGLMWAETYGSGHMGPEFQPRVAYRHLEWLLKRVDRL